MDRKLVFKGSDHIELKMYSDSGWANERGDRKSTGGWLTTINGNPVAWQSKKQSIVAQSSTEAELYALCESVNESLFIRQWFRYYLGMKLVIPIYGDNQGSLKIADHTTSHNRTKHIDIKYLNVRNAVRNKKMVTLLYIPTAEMLADILTKAVKKQTFEKLINLLYHE